MPGPCSLFSGKRFPVSWCMAPSQLAIWFFSSLFVQIAAVFMHIDNPSELSRLNRVAAYYLMATSFYAVIWTARLSILLSIIRIYPDPVTRRRLRWLAAAFIAAFFFLISQLFWTCENIHDGWKNKPSPQCHLPKAVAICQLVSTCIFVLLTSPPPPLAAGIKTFPPPHTGLPPRLPPH